MDTKNKFILIIVLTVIGSVLGLLKFQKVTDTLSYSAAQPSHGPFIKLMNVEVSFTGNIGSAIIHEDQAQFVKRRQKVVLYDQEGNTLPVGGEVRSLKNASSKTKVTIFTPVGTKTDLLKRQVSIITNEINNRKRLPISALQFDDDQAHVWRAKKAEEDKYKIEKVVINIAFENETLFVTESTYLSSKDFIIINPGKNLSDGKKYKINIIDLDLPLHNPIKQAWVDFEMNLLKQEQVDLQKTADECGKAKTGDANNANSTSGGNSCGTDIQSTDPFVIFQNLTGQTATQ